MQVVSTPVPQNTLIFDSDDWRRLGKLMTDFDKVCNSQSCETCPLADFCNKYSNPADYLRRLYDFIDD